MQEQGPRTPSPTPEVSAGEEKIFSSENEIKESPIPDPNSNSHDGKTLASCKRRFDGAEFHPLPGIKRITDPAAFNGHYKNRTGLRGTHDPSPAIPEQFPLDANFQKP